MTIAIDIGNSSIHLTCRPKYAASPVSTNAASESITFRTRESGAVDQAARWIASRQPNEIRIASVCTPAEDSLMSAIKAHDCTASIRHLTFRDVPLPHRMDTIEKVGIDRLVAAWAACQINGGGPVAVIDSGSAITFDLVDESSYFCGGVIMPGLSMQAAILAKGTDRLFEIEFSSLQIHLPATNTADAIHAGILSSVVGGIERIYRHYQTITSHSLPVIGTGGDVAWLSPLLNIEVQMKPQLVCEGILDLPLT
jgi:type III pantothenate kinase